MINKLEMVSGVLCFCLMIIVTNAATGRGPLQEKPEEFENIEGCYLTEIHNVIPFGKSITVPGACQKITCSEKYLLYYSCGTVFTDDPMCYVTETDLTRLYPDCCPTVICETENNLD